MSDPQTTKTLIQRIVGWWQRKPTPPESCRWWAELSGVKELDHAD